jgi:hypothetical protein
MTPDGDSGSGPAPRQVAASTENRLAGLFSEFRGEAEKHGMHDQVIELSERFIARAYQRGLEDGRSA